VGVLCLLFPNPKVSKVRIGGNFPGTQESAFQWIENLSMRELVIMPSSRAKFSKTMRGDTAHYSLGM